LSGGRKRGGARATCNCGEVRYSTNLSRIGGITINQKSLLMENSRGTSCEVDEKREKAWLKLRTVHIGKATRRKKGGR